MTSLTEALSTALLHFVWQGIAGGAVFGVVLLLWRKNSADSRYVASCIVLAALALAPVITFGIAYQTAAVPMRTSVDESGTRSVFGVSPLPGPLPEKLLGSLDSWILPLWAAGVLAFTLRLAWAGGHASSLRRHGVKADPSMDATIAGLADRLGIRRKLRVLISPVAEVPAVVGWIRPMILLPAAVVVGLTPQQLESLLAHELAHIRRYDYFVNILQMIVETFLFYHPVVWWVSSRIRYERELCCDDLAVRSCGNALSYARALAQLEKLRLVAPSLAMGSANGPLFHRIQRLLGSPKYEQVPSKLACAVGLLAGLLCLGWFMTARAQQPELLPPLEELTPVEQAVAPLPVPAPPSPPLPPSAPTAAAPQSPVAPLAPLSPTPASPPAPALPAPQGITPLPAPAATPAPPTPSASLLALLSVLQTFSPSQESHWVLFRGNAVITRGNAADEEQAKKARGTLAGDLLWFQVDGKAFITQDKDVMDRLQVADSGIPQAELVILQLQRQTDQRLALVQAQVQASQAQVEASIEQLERSLRRIPGGDGGGGSRRMGGGP